LSLRDAPRAAKVVGMLGVLPLGLLAGVSWLLPCGEEWVAWTRLADQLQLEFGAR
jgi:hypothetical protein